MIDYLKLIYYLFHPKTLFVKKRSGAVGDDLLMSLTLPGLKKKFPDKKIIVEARWVDLFKNNPFVHWVTDKHLKTIKKHLKPKYKILPELTEPITIQMLKSVGLNGTGAPEIYLSEEELRLIKEKYTFPYIVIAPIGKQKFSSNRKDWGIENFQIVRDSFPGYKFIQTGAKSDTLLDNVIDERGLGMRHTAAMLKNCLFFFGLEGGLMHLSKAVGTKSVIIFGGVLNPKITGYKENLNISTTPECSPCFNSTKKIGACETMICMTEIKPGDVVNQISEFVKIKANSK